MSDFEEYKNDINRIEFHKWGVNESDDNYISQLILDREYIKVGDMFTGEVPVTVLDTDGGREYPYRIGDQHWCSARGLLHTRGRYTEEDAPVADNVNHPSHYTAYKGIEVIQLTEHLNFCRGNVVKYVARAAHKGSELEDLKKAEFYLKREIERLEGGL